jgi:aminoglycoside phosphotransferase (APT) family kinase protein
MNLQNHPSEKKNIQALLETLAPGSTLLAIEPLPGSYSNYTHLVIARSGEGADIRFVVRRYQVFGSYDRGEKARREYKTFELLQRFGIPAPQPLYLDEEGAVLGSPGIVTSYVPGRQIEDPPDPIGWAHALAAMLAKIHAVPCDQAAQKFLLDGDAEASWFINSDTVPDYMAWHPDGQEVWNIVRSLAPKLRPAAPVLLHIDYWPGNILWDQDRISAVLDWEEAAFGDPAIDVAYCRMELILTDQIEAAAAFLAYYESAAGHPVVNLGFWELAAAARPMFSPEGRLSTPPARDSFRQFIAAAKANPGI